MKKMMKWLVLVLSVVAIVAPAGAMEKNMVYSSPYNITTLDPSVSYSTESQSLSNIYENLLRVNPPGSKELYMDLFWHQAQNRLGRLFHLLR